jgi:hypothetical protein
MADNGMKSYLDICGEKYSNADHCFLSDHEVNILTFPKSWIDIPVKDDNGEDTISIERVCVDCLREWRISHPEPDN